MRTDIATLSDWPALRRLVEKAHSENPQLPLHAMLHTGRRAVASGEVLYVEAADRTIVGYIMFEQYVLPDTHEVVLIERMLYILPDHRNNGSGKALLETLEYYGRAHAMTAILAGASLNCNEAARTMYEGLGFKTTYSFRKDLHNV